MSSTTEHEVGPRLRVVRDGDQPAGEPPAGRVVPGEVVAPAWGTPGRVVEPRPVADDEAAVAPVRAARRERIVDRADRPVIPASLRDREARAALARHGARYAGHATAFHAVRAPKYAAKAVVLAPVGVAKVATGVARFVADRDAAELRRHAIASQDPRAYLSLEKERNAKVRRRGQAAVALAVALTVAVLVAWLTLPGWALALLVAGVVAWLGHLGSPPGRPLVESSVTTFDVPRLTHPIIEAALGALGIGELNRAIREGRGPTFPSDVARDGAGYRAEVDLPLGVTPGDVLDRRDRLASGLRRPLGCVWPEGDQDVHEGRLVLWVGDKDLAKAGRIPWQLAKAGAHDVFKPFPLGRDPRGRTVTAPLVEHNWLIGSMPGQGKTATVRVISCAAALDPTVELWLHELKGTGDLDGLEQVSHRYRSGVDDESIEYTAESLAMLREEVRARGARLKKLPPDLAPDKKVTRGIASKRSMGLHPIVCVIDECQNLFADKNHGRQAGEDAEYVIKLGRALGVILVLATQRPDKDSLPTGISGNVSQRFCLHVAGQVENDMILGTSAYKNGYRATMFRPGTEAGIGIQKGARTAPIVLKTAYLDGPTTSAIGRRARAMREAAGTLTGHAVGQEVAREREQAVNVPLDVLAVFQPDERAVWNETLLERLVELRPGHYDGWTSAQLTAALKARGLDVVRDVHREKTTKRGVRADLLRAGLDDE